MPDAAPGAGCAPDQPTPLAEADLTPSEIAFLTTHAGVPAATDAQLEALRERSAAREASVTAGSRSLERAAAHTGRTAGEIRADIEAGVLLAYATGATGQTLLLPAWQFTPDGRTLPHLPEVIAALGSASASALQSVMTTPTADLGDTDPLADPVTPAAWLASGRGPEPVLSYLSTLGEQI